MRYASFLAVAALVFALHVVAAAQDPPPLTPGARLRVRAGETHIGTLISLDGANLVLARLPFRDTLSVSRSTIRRLEVSQGKKSSAGRGALIGGIAGAGVGLLAGVTAAADECANNDPGFCIDLFGPEDIPVIVLVASGSGAVVGALIGAFGRTDRWMDVPLEGLQLGLVPLRGGRIGFGLLLRPPHCCTFQ